MEMNKTACEMTPAVFKMTRPIITMTGGIIEMIGLLVAMANSVTEWFRRLIARMITIIAITGAGSAMNRLFFGQSFLP